MAKVVVPSEHIAAVVKTKSGEDFPVIATTHPDLEPFKADAATAHPRDTGSVEKRSLRQDVTKEYAEFLAKNKDMTPEQKREVLLTPNPHRFVMFPIQHFPIWKAYKTHQAMFWVAEEIDLAQDVKDFETLKKEEQHFLRHVLAFFAASDGIVSENLAQRFMNDVQIPEARSFYSFQLMMENIHSETYSKLIDTLIKDLRLRAEAFRATETMPAVNKKAAWAYRWITSSRSFAERLVAFAAVEGLFFSSSFCSIFWMKRRGKMPGLCQSNELISRDEGLHQQFACLLYSMLQEKLSREAVYEIVEWAVEIECGFVREALPWELRGMNAELMQDYVEYCADILLQQLGYAKRWHTPNPFDWMEAISLQGKTNFFEKKVTDYQLKGVMDELAKLEVEFNARKAAEAEAASGATPAPDDGVNASSTSQDSGDGSDLDCSAASASSTDTVGGTPTHHKHQLLPAMAAMTPTSVPGGLSFDEEF